MRLIIVDGLDGVGKDTHAQLIKERYERKGETVIIRSHPESDNFYGIKSKRALLGKGKINRLIASVFYALDVLRSLRQYYRIKKCDTLIMVRYRSFHMGSLKGLFQFLSICFFWTLNQTSC